MLFEYAAEIVGIIIKTLRYAADPQLSDRLSFIYLITALTGSSDGSLSFPSRASHSSRVPKSSDNLFSPQLFRHSLSIAFRPSNSPPLNLSTRGSRELIISLLSRPSTPLSQVGLMVRICVLFDVFAHFLS